MRNPKRIKRICGLIEAQWSLVPDQRLGQFLANYVFGHHQDIFFQDDDKTEFYLQRISDYTKKDENVALRKKALKDLENVFEKACKKG